MTAFGVCHIVGKHTWILSIVINPSLLGMTSALTNPLLYGILNTNIRQTERPRQLQALTRTQTQRQLDVEEGIN